MRIPMYNLCYLKKEKKLINFLFKKENVEIIYYFIFITPLHTTLHLFKKKFPSKHSLTSSLPSVPHSLIAASVMHPMMKWCWMLTSLPSTWQSGSIRKQTSLFT